jgi:hypothetical protein
MFCEEEEFLAFLGKYMGKNNLVAAGIFNADKPVIPPLQKPQNMWIVTSKGERQIS